MSLTLDMKLRRGALDLAIELEVAPGETLAVVGPNGAGKTSLLQVVAGLLRIDQGRVTLDGRLLDGGAAGTFVEPADRELGYLFQDHRLFPQMSVLDNVAFGPRVRGRSRREARERAMAWLGSLGLEACRDLRPAALSGGQAQKVALARALAGEPRLLLLDEPLSAVDASARLELRRGLREHLAAFSNIDVQDPDVRRRVADETLPKLNEALAQYHVIATHVVIRSIRFRQQYEDQLQNKQFFIVQGRLDEARQRESVAKQETETLEKTILKDIALKREEWNKKVEELKSRFEIEVSQIEAESTRYTRQRRADADAHFAELKAEGDLAEVQAEALGERLKAEALSTKAGRTFSAIEAVRRFKMGDVRLNSINPRFLYEFGSMRAWRQFFLGE